ncbi:MAG: hypothetical protein ACYDA5_11805 [Vulcanimicrobiaceae bacterium]
MSPFNNQPAGKTGHEDILWNPEIIQYMETWADVPKPETAKLEGIFSKAPTIGGYTPVVPEVIVAFDGSLYEASADQHEPSRRVGYIKVGMVALNVQKYQSLSDRNMPFVDPMAVNRLQEQNAISMALPSAYLKEKDYDSIREGYRAAIFRHYSSDNTRIGTDKHTMLDTVIDLLRINHAVVNDGGREVTILPSCPSEDNVCKEQNVKVSLVGKSACPACKTSLFVTDTLRVWECFSEFSSNLESFNRLMLATEGIVLAHSLLFFKRTNQLSILSNFAFVMDGPLSISGEAAKFHAPIMSLINQLQIDMIAQKLAPPLIMGLTKTGMSVEHFMVRKEAVPDGIAFPLTDEYRYTNIVGGNVRTRPFGEEFYYGQDVLLKTDEGRQFLISLPYPWDSKQEQGFKKNRFDLTHYRNVDTAIGIINMFQSDLYENSMVPVILAHEYASISLTPGGKILDLVTARALGAA